jgi:hypothetical protein
VGLIKARWVEMTQETCKGTLYSCAMHYDLADAQVERVGVGNGYLVLRQLIITGLSVRGHE